MYVAEPTSINEVRSVLVDALGVTAAGDNVPIQVVVSGVIEAYRHDFRERPAPGGISVSNSDADAAASVTSAGTMGCLASAEQEPRNARVMILSNNHVIAGVNAGAAGNVITQPGTLDGGASPADQIAVSSSSCRWTSRGRTSSTALPAGRGLTACGSSRSS